MSRTSDWILVPGFQDDHPTIEESTTGVLACGDSWCTGKCGLPALILDNNGRELKVYGAMTAIGPVVQAWRVEWAGKKVHVSLGNSTMDSVLNKFWM